MAAATLALQRTAGNAAVASAVARAQITAAVQRSVVSFDARTKPLDPPATDLKEELEENEECFNESVATINQRVDARLINPLKRTRESPVEVVATLTQGVTNPVARRQSSANVGAMGHDEFYIRRGVRETFEGGHIIPHAQFDSADAASDKADHYDNLVPMSRKVNVDDWARKERAIHDKLASMPPDDQLSVTVPIENATYKVSVADVADRFGLTVRMDADRRLPLYEWIPSKIGAVTLVHAETLSDDELSETEENELRRPRPMVRTGPDVIAALREFGVPIHRRLAKKLRGL